MQTAEQELPEVVEGRALLFVSASTGVAQLAGSIADLCRAGVEVRTRSLGAGAINQAIKAFAVARKHLANEYELVLKPKFETVQINGQDRSALTLVVTLLPKEI
jgi:stage V sporulation protein S